MSGVDDTAEIIDAVVDLMDQISGAGFRDAHGHPIELNVAYRELVAILTVRGLVGPEALKVRKPRAGDGEI
jgi:hypothetical protein